MFGDLLAHVAHWLDTHARSCAGHLRRRRLGLPLGNRRRRNIDRSLHGHHRGLAAEVVEGARLQPGQEEVAVAGVRLLREAEVPTAHGYSCRHPAW